jgi:hypothetical protein
MQGVRLTRTTYAPRATASAERLPGFARIVRVTITCVAQRDVARAAPSPRPPACGAERRP